MEDFCDGCRLLKEVFEDEFGRVYCRECLKNRKACKFYLKHKNNPKLLIKEFYMRLNRCLHSRKTQNRFH